MSFFNGTFYLRNCHDYGIKKYSEFFLICSYIKSTNGFYSGWGISSLLKIIYSQKNFAKIIIIIIKTILI